MKEEIKKLEELQNKIQSMWELLHVEDLKKEINDYESVMQKPGFWQDQERAREISKKHEELRGDVESWTTLRTEVNELADLAKQLQDAGDQSMQEDIQTQIATLEKQLSDREFFVLLDGKHDTRNAIVAVHAGSGGTEAQDWAAMLLRMVLRYCEKKNWKTVILDQSAGQEAGIKSTVFRVEGRYAYGHLQSEHGTHRLVRISPFDAEQMRHTSFDLIEIIPELDTSEAVNIDPNDLRIDTFMSGGKGGQSVNTTYSAVRIVHIPTGITVSCQNERSQQQNKEVALRVLQSKLQKLKEEEEEKEKQALRGEYKSAEWGNQIRSYVLHPYKMVKDVRTKYETADPEDVLNGNLDPLVEAYLKWKKLNSKP